ncbi:hypothetical protein HHL16_17220 [Pseudoflavitalea sp. G-6-1-2]|uniref:hypothetical protein n=1 Tax=Pseudoflavitalea sp. G-6-1-2 TaxID=2728841 RepID=UPI00146C6A48|nr:hypothetical protein [Pseudoflavitalea sp. G-6-1-2]NML22627.1 hypothetical protein [Pseudoflavitalea sp. G-6-1-2]
MLLIICISTVSPLNSKRIILLLAFFVSGFILRAEAGTELQLGEPQTDELTLINSIVAPDIFNQLAESDLQDHFQRSGSSKFHAKFCAPSHFLHSVIPPANEVWCLKLHESVVFGGTLYTQEQQPFYYIFLFRLTPF